MADVLHTLVPVGRKGNNLLAVVLTQQELPDVGESLDLMHGNKFLGHHRVLGIKTKQLSDVSYDDLVGFVYPEPTLFRNRIVAAAGVPNHGAEVAFITLGVDWDEGDDDDSPSAEPVRRTRYWSYED